MAKQVKIKAQEVMKEKVEVVDEVWEEATNIFAEPEEVTEEMNALSQKLFDEDVEETDPAPPDTTEEDERIVAADEAMTDWVNALTQPLVSDVPQLTRPVPQYITQPREIQWDRPLIAYPPPPQPTPRNTITFGGDYTIDPDILRAATRNPFNTYSSTEYAREPFTKFKTDEEVVIDPSTPWSNTEGIENSYSYSFGGVTLTEKTNLHKRIPKDKWDFSAAAGTRVMVYVDEFKKHGFIKYDDFMPLTTEVSVRLVTNALLSELSRYQAPKCIEKDILAANTMVEDIGPYSAGVYTPRNSEHARAIEHIQIFLAQVYEKYLPLHFIYTFLLAHRLTLNFDDLLRSCILSWEIYLKILENAEKSGFSTVVKSLLLALNHDYGVKQNYSGLGTTIGVPENTTDEVLEAFNNSCWEIIEAAAVANPDMSSFKFQIIPDKTKLLVFFLADNVEKTSQLRCTPFTYNFSATRLRPQPEMTSGGARFDQVLRSSTYESLERLWEANSGTHVAAREPRITRDITFFTTNTTYEQLNEDHYASNPGPEYTENIIRGHMRGLLDNRRVND